MSRRNKRIIIGVAGLLLFFVSWGRFFYVDGPYKGKVVDMETKQPIQGVAVLAVWSEAVFDPVHGQVNFYEAKGTLTDEEGNFTIPILWMASVNPLSVIQKPLFYMFKPGYAAYGGWSINPVNLGENVRVTKKWWRTIVELRRLTTREERLRNLDKAYLRICTPELPEGLRDVSPHCIPRQKVVNFISLREAEEKNLSLK